MQSKVRNYVIVACLFTSMSLIACGGGGGGGGDEFDENLQEVSNTDFEAEEDFSFEVAIENRSLFTLQGISGEITITGIAGANSVIITGTKRVQSESMQDAQEHLQELEVNVQSLANAVRVETRQPQEREGRNYIVDYMITLPNNVEVAVISLSGNVTLVNIVGSALVSLLSGTIEGDITLPVNGTIDLNTLSGDINLALPVNTSAEFSATVTIGSISVSNLLLQNEVRTPTSLRGTLGSGQGTISLETEQLGDISVSGF